MIASAFLTLALMLPLPQDAPQPATRRWDEKVFGFSLEKPAKGRFWKVSHTIPNSDGAMFNVGDEILELNGKQVFATDDAMAILKASGDSVTVKAKRYVYPNGDKRKTPRRVIDTAEFKRRMLWDIYARSFTVKTDALRGYQTWTPKYADLMQNQTCVMPSLIIDKDTPIAVLLKIQYYGKDVFGMDDVHFRQGDKTWSFDKSYFDVNTDIGSAFVRETLIHGEPLGGTAEAIVKHIGTHSDAMCLVRMESRNQFIDHQLTEPERIAFASVETLLLLAHQRSADLKTNPPDRR